MLPVGAARDRAKALVSRGYFPRELPPAFTTADFGQHCLEIVSDWKSFGVFSTKRKAQAKFPNAYRYKLAPAEAEVLSAPKRGYERRTLHITHPVPQALLSLEIAKNWLVVKRWLARRAYSLDSVAIDSGFERAVEGIDFAVHSAKKSYIESLSNWVVRTDITRFYPSVYTHSISWAAYGKERVKPKPILYDGCLADRFDQLVRACNRNETVGIPIGPETSRILAEIISARIDESFAKCHPELQPESVDRLQDDWFVGVASFAQAEAVLHSIASCYRAFGLAINGSKTSIVNLVASSRPHWSSDLKSFLSHRTGSLGGERLRSFLSLGLRLQCEAPSEPVLTFLLSVLEGTRWHPSDVEPLESFLLKAAVIAPQSMDRICGLLLNIHSRTGRISVARVGERFLELVQLNLAKDHHYEVIWLLYALRGLNYEVDVERFRSDLEGSFSSAIALILLDIEARGHLNGALPKKLWLSRITSDSICSDGIWLLAYEAGRHGWMPIPRTIMQSALFRPLINRDVVFYDEGRNVSFSERLARRRRHLSRESRLRVLSLLESLRGFDWDGIAGDY